MARGLYIHIPFCVKKCAYCDFVSFADKNAVHDKDAYIDALFCELQQWRGNVIDSIFIGGGTPTCLSAEQIRRLLLYIKDCFEITSDYEWTVEANPGTLDIQKLEIMRECGVNRLSIGVQSFSDSELLKIGRIHDAKTALDTIRLARRAGFDNINIDIMSALPGQTPESIAETMKTAVSLKPQHISCYSLILEEGTQLYDEVISGALSLPDEDSECEMFEIAKNILEEAGYERYEISNFAKPDKQCRHNLKYWHCDEYIGAGLAAHSYIGGERFYNTSDLARYISGKRVSDRQRLSDNDRRAEFIIMALRLSEGVAETEYRKRFGCGFYESYRETTDKFLRLGLMEKTASGFRLSEKGMKLSNSVMCEYV